VPESYWMVAPLVTASVPGPGWTKAPLKSMVPPVAV
jgi:hypothetical protein